MIRFIPKITIFDRIAYQTVGFKKNIYLGDPLNIANILGDQNAQELMVCFAEHFDSALAENLIANSRMPLSLAGVPLNKLSHTGADKIVIGLGRSRHDTTIKKASQQLGSQAISLSIDYIENGNRRIAMTGPGRKKQQGELHELLEEIDFDIYGELILNSITRDGSQSGLDVDVSKSIPDHVHIPTLIAGGCVGEDDLTQLPENIDGVIASSVFFLYGTNKAPLTIYPPSQAIT